MTHDDDVREERLSEERATAGDSDASGGWREVSLHSRDQGPSDKAAAALSDMVTALLSDMVTELENLDGISASRIEAILRGEAATSS